jgi:phage shock protein E
MFLIVLTATLAAGAALAQPSNLQPAPARPPSRIDYPGFTRLAANVQAYRDQRLVSLERFNALAAQRSTLILDARSPEAFRAGHIRGAVNLTLADFTAGRLGDVIGDPNRPILIYCNNNFEGDRQPVPTKLIQLALNIQTFINLVGYGYRNVYELRDTVSMDDPAVHWVSG